MSLYFELIWRRQHLTRIHFSKVWAVRKLKNFPWVPGDYRFNRYLIMKHLIFQIINTYFFYNGKEKCTGLTVINERIARNFYNFIVHEESTE